MHKCILFDMDGTLVNTYEGIFNSYKYAFEKMNLDFPGQKFVGKVIGAPLLSVFKETLGLSDEKALEAVEHYRKYYSEFGKDELVVYDGIRESLAMLKQKEYFLGIATLKREIFAKEILKNQELEQYFDIVCGIDENDKLTKCDLLKKCMIQLKCKPAETILVGDSEYDAEGAEEAAIDFMAVLYGFGFQTEESLKRYKLKFIAEKGEEIPKKILQ